MNLRFTLIESFSVPLTGREPDDLETSFVSFACLIVIYGPVGREFLYTGGQYLEFDPGSGEMLGNARSSVSAPPLTSSLYHGITNTNLFHGIIILKIGCL